MADIDLAGAVGAIQSLVPHDRMISALRDIEAGLTGANNKTVREVARSHSSSPALLRGVLELKRITSPADAYIHEPADAYIRAHAAIHALCSMLDATEVTVAVSLDGGHSGRCCAVVTDRRVIELHLSRWRQPEDDRASAPHFMADVFFLAEDPIHLEAREIYVVDTFRPRLFLETPRATVGEVLAQTAVPTHRKFSSAFREAAPKPIPAYWAGAKSRVKLRDLGEVAPRLRRTLSRLTPETRP